jgi:O-antigen ligase
MNNIYKSDIVEKLFNSFLLFAVLFNSSVVYRFYRFLGLYSINPFRLFLILAFSFFLLYIMKDFRLINYKLRQIDLIIYISFLYIIFSIFFTTNLKACISSIVPALENIALYYMVSIFCASNFEKLWKLVIYAYTGYILSILGGFYQFIEVSLGNFYPYLPFSKGLKPESIGYIILFPLYGGNRIISTMDEPNTFGAFVGIGLIFIISYIININKFRLVHCIWSIIATIVLFSTGSRSSVIALILAIISLVIISRRNERKITIIYIIIFMAGFILMTSYFPKINQALDQIFYRRIQDLISPESSGISSHAGIIKAGLEVFKRKNLAIIFGTGFGDYIYEYSGSLTSGTGAHNVFILTLVEQGAIGLLLLLIFIFKLFRQVLFILKKTYENDNPRFRALGVSLFSVFIFLLFVFNTYGSQYYSYYIWIYFGIIRGLFEIVSRNYKLNKNIF